MGNRTGRIAVLGAWLTVGALCFASSAQAAKLEVSTQSGDPGTQVTFTVTLRAEGASVAGTQNDISFDAANIPVAAKANGKPDCAVNPDIDKGATSFAFRESNTKVRALVLSTDNVDPVVDGAVLYTCKVNIAAGASGSFPLTITGVILSDPNGNQVPGASGTSGAINAGGPPPTPTTGPSACNPPAIKGATVNADSPSTVSVDFTLELSGQSVAGTQNDIAFAAPLAIAAKANGKPDCAVNPDIDKGATSFAFRESNTKVRALVLSTDNVDPIAAGAVLYTCKVNVAAGATGSSPLTVIGVIFSDPSGNQVPGASGCNGSVTVGPPPPTPTEGVLPTETPPPPATNTPTFTPPPPTNTVAPTATRTQPPVPTATKTSAAGPTPFEEDGGCHISTTGSSNAAWLLLIPVVGLLVMRRRHR